MSNSTKTMAHAPNRDAVFWRPGSGAQPALELGGLNWSQIQTLGNGSSRYIAAPHNFMRRDVANGEFIDTVGVILLN
jgi:hypothetical protein